MASKKELEQRINELELRIATLEGWNIDYTTQDKNDYNVTCDSDIIHS